MPSDWSPMFKQRFQRNATAADWPLSAPLDALWRAFLTSVVGDEEKARLIHERSKRQARLKLPRTRGRLPHRAIATTPRGDYSPRKLTYPRSDVIGSPLLTASEVEVLTLLAAGVRTPAIAARLGRSPFTVARQMLTASRRLGVSGTVAAVARAIRSGQVLPPARKP